MLEHTLARLKACTSSTSSSTPIFAEQIVDRLKGRAQVIVEDRPARHRRQREECPAALGDGPFFVLNGDSLWRDGPQEPTLERMEGADRMDALLLLHLLHKVIGREAKDRGDYFIEPRGRLRHRGQAPSPYVFASVSLCHPRLFRFADGPFSLLQLWHRAEAEGRLHGMIHDGEWFHIGTPRRSPRQEALAERKAERVSGLHHRHRPSSPTSWRWACWRNMAAIRWRWPTC